MKIKYDFRLFLRKRFGKTGLVSNIGNLINYKDSRSFFYKMLFLICLVAVFLILLTNLQKIQPAQEKPKETVSESRNQNTEGQVARKVIVVADAGHGGNDWGTHYGSIKEKDINLDIALRFGRLLEEKSIQVIYIRKKDQFVDLQKRPEIANDCNATLFISIHNNNLPGNTAHKGTETLYASSVSTRFKTMNDKKLADIIEKELTNALGTANGGVIKRPDLAVLHHTKMPAVIAEIGYVSNKADRSKLTSEHYRQKAAEALCNAVFRALADMGAYKDKSGIWMVYERKQ